MRLVSLVCGLFTSIIYLMVSYIFNRVWKVDHAVKLYTGCPKKK
jgi:hypothetical protein